MFSKNTLDDAVSPVVGVILMVAVTVILAAVIASFVLDLGSNVQANPQAGVTFDETASDDSGTADTAEGELEVQVVSLENADSVSLQTTNADSGGESAISGSFTSPVEVGDTVTVSNLEDGDTVSVIGELDGKEAVIQSYTFG